ncbi:GNAT family N-acetyltransferase [Serratia fonticola]|uniref:GNAT family N-acetyltransferase n=1 Tax=Serratia fonticola TaxID=47917 RepID=UPI003BB512FE
MSITKPLNTQQSFASGYKSCTKIIMKAAYEVRSDAVEIGLVSLLLDCFDGIHEGRTFVKQEPHHRLLAFSGNHLIAHLGIDFRIIRVGEELIPISGIIDLCVHQDYRGNKLAGDLLAIAERVSSNRDFVILMADDNRLYRINGYLSLTNANSKWLAIDALHSHSVIQRDLSEIFMYKAMKNRLWPKGKIDLLGYLF